MIKLFGHPASTCSRKVLCTLHETDTPYELVVVDLTKGEHKAEPHLSRQPFGQVPAIDDDGFALYESRAIARYLDEKAGFKLTPRDPRQRARMEQWISVETSNFTPHAMKFIYDEVFKYQQAPEALAKAAEGLAGACAVLDKALAGKTYLLGDAFSLADICFAPYFEYGMMTAAKATLARSPNVMAWWGRVSERPTWRKAAGR